MKAWWALQAARIDALSLRERVFLFLSLIACGLALVDALWLAPAQGEHRELRQRVIRQTAELTRLREELRASAAQPDARRQLRDELEQLKQRNEALTRDIASTASSAVAGAALQQVLVQFLRKHEGLTLVQATTQAPEAALPQDAPNPGISLPGLRRQGLMLTVAGPYPELIRYVQTLEHALPTLRWGDMKLAGDLKPPQLSLQVSVVEVTP